MGVSLSGQLRSLALSFLLGICCALLYELLRSVRIHRRRSHGLTHLLDGCYCFILALLFSAFALHIGEGELRLYMLFSALFGALLYFLLLSALLRPLWTFWADIFFAFLRLLRVPFRWLKIFYGKLNKLCKIPFSFSPRRSIINNCEREAASPRRRRRLHHGKQRKTAPQYAGSVRPAPSACDRGRQSAENAE